jgi:uncharacterized protein YbaR (Trm112 family)
VSIDAEFLSILVCPDSKKPLVEVDGDLVSTDPETRRKYRVEEGIPQLLVEESEQLDEAAWKAAMESVGQSV